MEVSTEKPPSNVASSLNPPAVSPAESSTPILTTPDLERTIREAAQTARANAERHERLSAKPLDVKMHPVLMPGERAAMAYEEAERRKRAFKVEEIRKSSRVPKRYAAAALDEQSKVPADCKVKYGRAVSQLRGLMERPATVALIGNRGPGKTHMSCALVNAYCDAGKSARYLNAMDYFIELKSTYDKDAKRDEAQVERDYLRPALLVVDELHERGETDWETRMLTRLVNRRYEEEKATVLVCNLSLAEFEKRVGDSIADRIAEGGGVIVCDWSSLRGRLL